MLVASPAIIKPLILAALGSIVLFPSHTHSQPVTWGRGFYKLAEQANTLKTPDLAAQDALTSIIAPLGTYSNDYAWGNCTWYVASRLPVPNSMGNANNWAYSASMSGLNVSNTPRVGAIAQTSGDSWLGHVAIVESINDDGTFVVSEMNYAGLGIVDTRTTSTDEFPSFIYI